MNIRTGLLVASLALAAGACDRRETDGHSSTPQPEGAASTDPASTTSGSVPPPASPDPAAGQPVPPAAPDVEPPQEQ